MTRAVVFLAAAMVAASLGLVAQDTSGALSNPNQERGSVQRDITATGCLNASASGGFLLSDDHGAIYALSGDTDSLRSRISREIEVTGQQQFAAGASSGASSISTIQVANTKVIADHCASVSTAQSKHDRDASDIASVDDAVNNGQLPQTSTILPLLGLIGLGSLVAGFFARY